MGSNAEVPYIQFLRELLETPTEELRINILFNNIEIVIKIFFYPLNITLFLSRRYYQILDFDDVHFFK